MGHGPQPAQVVSRGWWRWTLTTTFFFFLQNEMCTPEAALHIEGTSCPHGWPEHGEIVFQDYQMKYRDSTPVVLKGINLTIRSQEVVGVVGRTGSGELSGPGGPSSALASGGRTCFRAWVCRASRCVGPCVRRQRADCTGPAVTGPGGGRGETADKSSDTEVTRQRRWRRGPWRRSKELLTVMRWWPRAQQCPGQHGAETGRRDRAQGRASSEVGAPLPPPPVRPPLAPTSSPGSRASLPLRSLPGALPQGSYPPGHSLFKDIAAQTWALLRPRPQEVSPRLRASLALLLLGRLGPDGAASRRASFGALCFLSLACGWPPRAGVGQGALRGPWASRPTTREACSVTSYT